MPVRKFKSVEAMERHKWREPGDPALYRAIAAVLEFGRRVRPRRFPAGVYRHRTMAELNAQTERWRTSAAPVGETRSSNTEG
jgi:hypothetical protein